MKTNENEVIEKIKTLVSLGCPVEVAIISRPTASGRSCRALVDDEVVASCRGGGYDMTGAVLDQIGSSCGWTLASGFGETDSHRASTPWRTADGALIVIRRRIYGVRVGPATVETWTIEPAPKK